MASLPQQGHKIQVTGFPSAAQIALALIVTKSKPAAENMEDYLARLRRHITPGNRPTANPVSRHLDSTNFWKQAYEKSAAAQAALLDKIYDLEQQQRPMKAADLETEKRGKHYQEMQKANRSSKRRGVLGDEIQTGGAKQDRSDIHQFEDGTVSFDAPKTLLRALFNLQQSLLISNPADRSLSSNLRIFARSAFSILNNFIDIELLGTQSSESRNVCQNVQGVCRAITGSYGIVIRVFERLHNTQQKGEGFRSCVAELVLLLQSVLGQLHAILLLHAESIPHQDDHYRRLKLGKAGIESFDSASKRTNTCKQLVRVIVNMFLELDLSQVSHIQLFEGLVCAFLDHLGSSLSLVVFSTGESSSSSNTLGILPPQGLQDSQGMDAETASRTALLEAPYLIAILKRVMSIVNDPPRGLHSPIVRCIKDRLQSTLLRGVFGDDDEAFQEALCRADPVQEGELGQLPSHSDQDEGTSEWYVGEIWQHLGWDTLSGILPNRAANIKVNDLLC